MTAPRPLALSRTLRTLALSTLIVTGCQGLEAPKGLEPARRSGGPVVTFDLFARPLPEVPLPNDIATRPDPSAPTGRRLNASLLAPTAFERYLRDELDRLDGWGTYAPIAVSFEPAEQRLDIGNILRRHSGDDFDFSDDALYLINIDPDSPHFGQAMALDIGEGDFPLNLRDRDDYWDNDPRGQTSTLFFETISEDTNGNGRLDLCEDPDHDGVAQDLNGDGLAFIAEPDLDGDGELDAEEDRNGNGRRDCSEDTDFDGVLDRPNLYCGDDRAGAPIDPVDCPDLVYPDPAGDVIIPADHAWFTSWYEQETNTLLAQPLVPLEEQTAYAVVLTNRLIDEEGRAVESPFAAIHHVDQTEPLRPLAQLLADDPETFGGLTIEDVQFAWTFTTQTVTGELHDLREGLYGRGPLAELAEEFPPDLRVDPIHGCAGSSCELPHNHYTIWSRETDGEPGLLDIIDRVLDTLPIDLGVTGDMVQSLLAPYDAVDYFAHLRFTSPDFLEHDGVTEDQDQDGRLDLIDEDLNDNGELDPGEDLDFDGHLDVNEDANENLILDGLNPSFDLDIPAGHAPHSQAMVTAFVAIPRADPSRGIVPPFPVVVYNHGYGVLRLELLVVAAYMARQGIATIGLDAAHHGLGVDPLLEEVVRTILVSENLGPLADALSTDRALDLNGDGMDDSGADYLTIDTVHIRDLIRQTALDNSRLVQILRSFDGSWRWSQDLDGDGEPELAGDFNGDGIVDLGGPEADLFVMGNSLGGIHSTVVAGLEPEFVAAAPISGGAGMSTIGMRTTLGNVQAPAILPAMGPLLVTNHATRYFDLLGCAADEDCPGGSRCGEGRCRCEVDRDCSDRSGYRCFEAPTSLEGSEGICARRGETACTPTQVSLRFVVNDLTSVVRPEIACLDEEELRGGDTLVAENLVNGERDCFVAWSGGRSRLQLPSDRLDPLRLEIYEGEQLVEGPRCTLAEGAEPRRIIDAFELDATFQQQVWQAGDPLQAPTRGLGMHRATPGLRRLMTIAQILLEPGDPANLARRAFLDPIDYGEETRPTPLLNISTVGDSAVAIASGIAIARSAGIIDYLRPEARLADAAHPEGRTQNRYLIDHRVIEGTTNLSPYRRQSDGRQVNFDPDDLDRSASPPTPGWPGDGLGAPSTAVPLRAWRALDEEEGCTCADDEGQFPCARPGDTDAPLNMVRCPGGVAAQAFAYFRVDGSHALIPEAGTAFDVHAFISNMIARYFATRGTELRWDLCLEDNSCTVEEEGFYTPPVIVDEGETE